MLCRPFANTGINGGFNGIDNGNEIYGGIGDGMYDIDGIDRSSMIVLIVLIV